jgi:hypothetical protein
MRKLWLSLLLAGCAATTEGLVPQTPVDLISPEADLSAPGMIPLECEALLQKSQAWGYRPGQNWVPKDLAMANEVAEFLGSFSMVPENTHRYYAAWEEKPNSANAVEAQKQLELLERAQVCDPNLTLAMLEGLMQFSWSRKDRQIVGKSVHRFVLNQQARKSFLLPRAICIRALELAYRNAYLKGDEKKLQPIRYKLEKFRPVGTSEEDPGNMEDSLKKELQLSDQIRADLSKLLPLP